MTAAEQGSELIWPPTYSEILTRYAREIAEEIPDDHLNLLLQVSVEGWVHNGLMWCGIHCKLTPKQTQYCLRSLREQGLIERHYYMDEEGFLRGSFYSLTSLGERFIRFMDVVRNNQKGTD